MALFIQKPVFWNTNNYKKPSGVIANSGFPKKNGFGHEEWNNSPRLQYTNRQGRFRVFHTEPLGNAPLQENAGQTFVFMTASHNNIQQLVGIAGNAVGMMTDDFETERSRLVEKLSLSDLLEEAWVVPNVQKQNANNKKRFEKNWVSNLQWIPTWICPDDFYWWLDEPVTLDSRAITGKNKLLGMFGSYTNLDLPTAMRILESVPINQRQDKWTRLCDALQCAPSEPLSIDEMCDQGESVTNVLTMANARRGQGQFREDLMKVWNGACAVTGLTCRTALRASHIKPWAISTNKQRLDSDNGLLLSANLDVLFDAGLLSFDSDGTMLISSSLDSEQRSLLGIPMRLRLAPSKGMAPYLSFHRTNIFRC